MRQLHNSQRPVDAPNKRLRINSNDNRRQRRYAHSATDSEAHWQSFRLRRRAHQHGVRDLQIVIKSKEREDHPERGQSVMSAFNQAQENAVLAQKPSGGWNAGE